MMHSWESYTVRLIDEEMRSWKRQFPISWRPHGDAFGSIRKQAEWESVDKSLHIGFHGVKYARQSE